MRITKLTFTGLLPFLAATLVFAQPEVTGEILNPYGLIPQGGSEIIRIRITNPSGSGVTVSELRSKGSTGVVSTDIPFGEARNYTRTPEVCVSSLACVLEGALPLLPGESLVLGFTEIVLPEEIGLLAQLEMSNIRLSLLSNGNPHYITFTNRILKYVEPAADLWNPNILSCDDSGLLLESDPMRPDIAAEVFIPETVDAGAPITLRVRLNNYGNQPVSFSRLDPGFELHGDHGGSYVFQQCAENYCGAATGNSLWPGEHMELELGTLYYSHDLLFPGSLQINALHMLMLETRTGVRWPLLVDPCGFSVAVEASDPNPVPNESLAVPQKQAPFVTDFLTAGDALLVRDPNTGYDWIRLDASLGLSSAFVATQQAPGGVIEDFRLASSSQVRELVLNHLYASGQPANSDLLNGFSNRINVALYDLVGMLGDYSDDSPGSSRIIHGIVRDAPPWNERDSETILSLNSLNHSAFSNPYNANVALRYQDMSRFGYQHIAHWLVDTHSTFVPAAGHLPVYHEDVLTLPSVQIGSINYYLVMNFNNPATGTLQYTDIAYSSLTTPTAVYNASTNTLDIPQLVVPDEQGTMHYYRLQLQFLSYPSSNLFRLIGAEYLGESGNQQ